MACSGALCSGLPVLGKGVSCAPRVSRRFPVAAAQLDLGRMPSGIVPRPHQAVSSMMVGIRTTADENSRVGGIADAFVLRLLGIRRHGHRRPPAGRVWHEHHRVRPIAVTHMPKKR